MNPNYSDSGNNEFHVLGDLTIRGVTREVLLKAEGVPLEFKDTSGKAKLRGLVTTKIKRQDFGLKFNAGLETVMRIDNEIVINIQLELTKRAASVATANPSTTKIKQ